MQAALTQAHEKHVVEKAELQQRIEAKVRPHIGAEQLMSVVCKQAKLCLPLSHDYSG